jgi:dihydropyrimidinase
MSHEYDIIIRSGTAVLPGQGSAPADIAIKDGKIAAILPPGSNSKSSRTIDAAGRYVTPGVVETHTHFGIGNGYEDLTTETFAALKGGVTTAFFFLRHPYPYDETFVLAKKEGEERSPIDFAFHIVLLNETHLEALPVSVNEWGVTSYKFYMTYRGKDAAMMDFDGKIKSFGGVDDKFMLRAMDRLAAWPHVLMTVHAENIEMIHRLKERYAAEGREDMNAWQASRPADAELDAVRRACAFATQTGARVMFFHLTTGAALDAIHEARARHPELYVEVCHPYLLIADDGTLGRVEKMKPPFRPKADVDALWRGVADGRVHTLASDHVPRPLGPKLGDLWTNATGAPGTPTLLPAIIEEGHHGRKIPLHRLFEALSLTPARLYGLGGRKGCLMPGADADLLILDIDTPKVVRAAEIGSVSDFSIYEGRALRGWPTDVLVRGRHVLRDGEPDPSAAGWGRYLPR